MVFGLWTMEGKIKKVLLPCGQIKPIAILRFLEGDN
tara:strand:+ start:568 stop:675 length:108 start_codon:yes stop_codon:yes gene_type:complete